MWAHFEPVHAVTYFHPHSRAAYEAVGLRGYWRGYFAGRAAPLGAVDAAPVIAAFFSFAPSMVTRALPAVWELAAPEQALQARLDGAVRALTELIDDQPDQRIAEAAELLEEAVAHLEPAGRVLGAANAALPRPEQPLARLWQAATTLREHRGDGHIAALVAAGLDPVETLAFRTSLDLDRRLVQPYRGWTDEQWQAGIDRLVARGWLSGNGQPTEHGIASFQAIEDATDRAAAGPWLAIGTDTTRRLRELLTPIARACRTVLPTGNPMGLPTTG
ncbi:MAG TPA: hypothetical protein VF174_08435 [Micromonosporaceae bacterium]